MVVVEYFLLFLVIRMASMNVWNSSYDKFYESTRLSFEFSGDESRELAKLLVSSDENYYYGLAKGSVSSTPNSIIFSMDSLLNYRWSIYVQDEIDRDLFFLSYDDASIYYIQSANGCTLVKQPTSGSSIEFSKAFPSTIINCRMMTMSKNSNYLYLSTTKFFTIEIYQFDVNQIAIINGI